MRRETNVFSPPDEEKRIFPDPVWSDRSRIVKDKGNRIPVDFQRRETAAASSHRPSTLHPPPPRHHTRREPRDHHPAAQTSDPEGFARRRWPTSRPLLTNTWSTVIEHNSSTPPSLQSLLSFALSWMILSWVSVSIVVMRGIFSFDDFVARFEGTDRARWGFFGGNSEVFHQRFYRREGKEKWREVRNLAIRFCCCEREISVRRVWRTPIVNGATGPANGEKCFERLCSVKYPETSTRGEEGGRGINGRNARSRRRRDSNSGEFLPFFIHLTSFFWEKQQRLVKRIIKNLFFANKIFDLVQENKIDIQDL